MNNAFTAYLWINWFATGFFAGIGAMAGYAIYCAIVWVAALGRRSA